ncbi:MAG: tRNA pseudouridine(55) synthase TruB [Clostridiales bacterium]|nr:tRNA pseudouridine(55) synthase TruB [Clostridiales bacterium]
MFLGGSINLLKPAGMTSHDCVGFFRRLSGIKRVGHAGTLDPMATGVLPLLIGNATRMMEYLEIDNKEYRCEMILGIKTDTQDIWGNVLEDNCNKIKNISEEQILRVFKQYTGEILQTPPTVSAVRVKGKRLYEYAREGKQVEIKPRPAIIHSIKVLTIDIDRGRIIFDINCSKGTYVRSICHDVGEELGYGASMSFLVRKRSGAFRLENTSTLEELKKDWKSLLLPLDFPLEQFGRLRIKPEREKWFSNGGYLRPKEVEVISEPIVKVNSKLKIKKEGLERAFNVYCQNRFLGVAIFDTNKGIYLADKVFCL